MLVFRNMIRHQLIKISTLKVFLGKDFSYSCSNLKAGLENGAHELCITTKLVLTGRFEVRVTKL